MFLLSILVPIKKITLVHPPLLSDQNDWNNCLVSISSNKLWLEMLQGCRKIASVRVSSLLLYLWWSKSLKERTKICFHFSISKGYMQKFLLIILYSHLHIEGKLNFPKWPTRLIIYHVPTVLRDKEHRNIIRFRCRDEHKKWSLA